MRRDDPKRHHLSNWCPLTRVGLALWTALASFASIADPPSFKISQIYSNLDGSTQFIRLTETQGLNGQHHFAGLTLTSTHNGITKQFVFPSDLPSDQTANRSIIISSSINIPVSGGGWLLAWVFPDFVIQERFLATDGGSVDFAGVDQVSYASLPTDGENGLNRNLSVGSGIVSPFRCSGAGPFLLCGSYTIVPTPVWVREFYNAPLDHYFYTAAAPDIDALDSGRFAGWQRTGNGFYVGTSEKVSFFETGRQPVCRYYIPPPLGDSHFFSASDEECAEVGATFPTFVLETAAAFYVWLPSEAGACEGAGQIPVYRLWNRRADSNHRYTTDKSMRAAMIGQGYVSEGYGPDGVAFCIAPWSPWDY